MVKRQKKRFSKSIIMPVLADGAVALRGEVGGRMVPVVMADLTLRPDVAELIRVHEHLGMGDCLSQWATTKGHLLLNLEFERPIELSIGLIFEMPRRAGLVDQILYARAVYLQHGLVGDRMSTTMDNARILVELPPTGFEEKWESLFPSYLAQQLRQGGMNRREAKEAAASMVHRWRKLGSIRLI